MGPSCFAGVGMYLLSEVAGIESLLLTWRAILAIMVLSIPINTIIATVMKRLQSAFIKTKDKRIQLLVSCLLMLDIKVLCRNINLTISL